MNDAANAPMNRLPAASDHLAEEASSGTWPPLQYEPRILEPDDSPYQTHRQRVLAKEPYLASVTPEIASLTSIRLPSDVATLASEAATAIARFDQEFGSTLANFSAILLRSESASSSEIENLTAGAKAIALAAIGERSKRNATLIVANATAMTRALELADHLDQDAILAMHASLLGDEHPEWVGHWRTDQVRIGGTSVHSAFFVPPHHERVPAAMDDLVRFLNRRDLPAFEQAAIAHAQFETIHPFPDGNGRVGRALIHALLKSRGLTHGVTVPVSAGLLANTGAYFDALTRYRTGDPATIVQLMAEASFDAINNGRQLVDQLREVHAEWRTRLKVRIDSSAWRVSELLMRQPAVTSSLVSSELGISQSMSDRAIARLAEARILLEVSGNRRNRQWVAPEVLSALDNFARRAKRGRI